MCKKDQSARLSKYKLQLRMGNLLLKWFKWKEELLAPIWWICAVVNIISDNYYRFCTKFDAKYI